VCKNSIIGKKDIAKLPVSLSKNEPMCAKSVAKKDIALPTPEKHCNAAPAPIFQLTFIY
jgi:hypothetical protein